MLRERKTGTGRITGRPPCSTASSEGSQWSSIDLALDELAAGRPVIVHGCETGEGGIVFSASQATTTLMAFTIRHSSGFVCVAMPGERCDLLNLPPMRRLAHDERNATYCVTVDASTGVGTGISATDRARAARLLAHAETNPDDFTRPGHLVPIAVGPQGVLGCAGLAEAATDLMWFARQEPACVLSHLVSTANPAQMAADRELAEFAARHGFVSLDVRELLAARRRLGEQSTRAAADTPSLRSMLMT